MAEKGLFGTAHKLLRGNIAKWLLHPHFHRLSTYVNTRAVFSVDIDNCATTRAVKCHLVLDGQNKHSEPKGKNTRNVLLLFIISLELNREEKFSTM